MEEAGERRGVVADRPGVGVRVGVCPGVGAAGGGVAVRQVVGEEELASYFLPRCARHIPLHHAVNYSVPASS